MAKGPSHTFDSAQPPPEAAADVEQKAVERLVFFSDAVVAIAITLLALDLPLPTGDTNEAALKSLSQNSDEYAAFLISFAVISSQWFGHHRVFRYVTAAKGLLARWSMLWLLTLIITPFATRVLTGDGGFQVRFIFYASVESLAGISFMLLLREIERHGLLRRDSPPDLVRTGYQKLGVVTGMFLLSIPISLVTQWAYLCWIAIPFVGWAVRRVMRRHPPPRAA